jgi:molybdopterin/thiamine biosynthesis adenylyltransferase
MHEQQLQLQIDPQWTILFLEDGSVFLDNIYGNHYRVRESSGDILYIFKALQDGPITFPDFITEHSTELGEYSAKKMLALVERLIQEKIIRKSVTARLSDLPIGLLQRFESQIWWFDSLDGPVDGPSAFRRLRESRVAIIGLGGAGTLCASLLAAAGVGSLTLVDGDTVNSSNLTRQLFYSEDDVRNSVPKVVAMKNHLERFSQWTRVKPISEYIRSEYDADRIIVSHDLVVLTADEPRITLHRLVNRACLKAHVSFLYCFAGQVGPFLVNNGTACFGCLEVLWRAESGAMHDALVQAHLHSPSRMLPSNGIGPTIVGSELASESIAFLSGAYPIRTSNCYLRYSVSSDIERVPCMLSRECIACARYRRKRP